MAHGGYEIQKYEPSRHVHPSRSGGISFATYSIRDVKDSAITKNHKVDGFMRPFSWYGRTDDI